MNNIASKKMTKVYAVASGKGGVGKTTVSLNLAVAFSKMGKKVLLFDADLSLGNITVSIGLKTKYSFDDFFKGKKNINEIVTNGPENIKILPASTGLQSLSEITEKQAYNFVNAFDNIKESYDILIVDCAAGCGKGVLSFLDASPVRLVVMNPIPASINDAYLLIKQMVLFGIKENIYVIPNMVKNNDGYLAFKKIYKTADNFLNLNLKYLNSIESDEIVPESIKKFKELLNYAPTSKPSKDITDLATELSKIPIDIHVDGGIKFFNQNVKSSD